ncbi:MAG: hypothetical protein EOO42_11755 [Flavobacteriales bacterium]|nr:MAG: hypothetical protein EOO42_11755 [Flavobacteriales bacterium]
MGGKVEIIPFSKEIVKQNMNFLIEEGYFSARGVEKILSFFDIRTEDDGTLLFGSLIKDELYASSIVFTDAEHKIAYIAFVCKKTIKVSGNHSVHAYIYDEIFKYLSKLGYEKVDLLGANLFSISKFKSKLSDDLSQYYNVKYSRRRSNAVALLDSIKKVIKKVLN